MKHQCYFCYKEKAGCQKGEIEISNSFPEREELDGTHVRLSVSTSKQVYVCKKCLTDLRKKHPVIKEDKIG